MRRRSPPSSTEKRAFSVQPGASWRGMALQAAALPAGADLPEGLATRAAEILADARYQTRLPLEAPERVPWSFLFDLGGAGRVLGYLLGFALLVGIVVWAMRAVGGRPTFREAPPAEAPRPPEPAATDPRGRDAARSLAAERRYAEAVHALLLDAIHRVERRPDVGPRPSRTSRELLGALARPAETREALEQLVGHVEASLFGGRPVGADECEACFRSHEALTRAEGA